MRRRGFDCVEAIGGNIAAVAAPPVGVVAGIADAALHGAEQIRIERDQNIGGIEFVNRIGVLAERQFGAGADAVRAERLVLNPLRRGKALLNGLELRAEGRRRDGLGENADSRALRLVLVLQQFDELRARNDA